MVSPRPHSYQHLTSYRHCPIDRAQQGDQAMRPIRRITGGIAVLGGLAVVLAACASGGGTAPGTTAPGGSSSGAGRSGARVAGGTARFAEAPNAAPNWIFPVNPSADQSVYNGSQFQYLMWRPLVWGGTGEVPGVNTSLSLFSKVAYTNGDRTVTVTLKHYRWSDGQPVTSRDLEFYYDIFKAVKTQLASYTPGELPDNVTSVSTPTPRTMVLNLDQAYSRLWFTDNELGLLTPIPQHAWDKTSATGRVGDYDMTAAGATRVFDYLSGQARDLSTYATNPLWQVVDGPWKLSAFTTGGQATFVPNRAYSGPVKPTLARFEELPFTTDSSEFNVLEAGGTIDVGYLPAADVGQKAALASAGYELTPWINLGIFYIIPNETSPQVGKILSQLYVRQALQHTIDQLGILKTIYHGYGVPTYGPIPTVPASDLTDSYVKANPYPFSIADAKKLLTDHGWKVTGGGPGTCARPGSGAGRCGSGIRAGAKLSFDLLYASGNQALAQQEEVIKSDASQAGIVLNLRQAPFATVTSTVLPCPTHCDWQLAQYGGISYSILPTGDGIFTPGSTFNAGSYVNPVNTANINATLHTASLSAIHRYEDFLAQQLPFLWTPGADYSLTEVRSTLQGAVPQNVYLALTPENWYFTR